MAKKLIDNNYLNGRLINLCDIIEPELALFFCCAIADVPFDENIEADNWLEYVKAVPEGSLFKDGITNVSKILHNLMDDEERWVVQWGTGSESNPYTEKDYRYMDELFRSYSARSLASGKYDPQTEFVLRNVCKQQLLADKSLAEGTKEGVEMHYKLSSTIQKALEAEKLRAKDEEQESVTLDDIETALQRKYGVGIEMTRDQAMELFYDWQTKLHYPNTQDAVDEAIKIIINNTRMNNDMQPIDVLPKAERFSQELAGSFDESPSFEEEEAFDYLGIERKPKGS